MMKRIGIVLLMFWTVLGFSQDGFYKMSEIGFAKRDGWRILRLLQDSRCAAGTNCVWAGEAVFEVGFYRRNKLVRKGKLSSNPNELEATNGLLGSFFGGKKILQLVVFPAKKEGKKIDLRSYKLLIYGGKKEIVLEKVERDSI